MVTYGHRSFDAIIVKREYYTLHTDKISYSGIASCNEYLATKYMKMNIPQVCQRLGVNEWFEVKIEHTQDPELYVILRITREDLYKIIDYYEGELCYA